MKIGARGRGGRSSSFLLLQLSGKDQEIFQKRSQKIRNIYIYPKKITDGIELNVQEVRSGDHGVSYYFNFFDDALFYIFCSKHCVEKTLWALLLLLR